MSARLVRGLLLLTLLSAVPVLAGNYRWTIQGPDGGSVDRIEFDPADPSIVYAATTNGLFRSADGGVHWVAVERLLGKGVHDVAVAAGDPQKVFAASVYGLHGSTDRGLTWHLVHPFASFQLAVSRDGAVVYSVATSGPIRSSDGGVTFGNTGSGLPPSTSVTALAIDPQNPDTVYAALLSTEGVYKSVDGGAHWTAASSGLTSSVYFSLIVDPSTPATLYLGSGGAIFKSIDGAASWLRLPPSGYYYSLAITPSAPATIVAGADRGVFKSTNGGSSWTGPKLAAVTTVAIDPANPANVLATGSTNLFRSTDGGANYALAGSGLTAHFTFSIAVDPRNASTVYTAGPAGVFKSTDRGRSWSTPTGVSTRSLAVDPFDSSIVYATTGDVVRSVDGGATWPSFRDGLPGGTATAVTTDPQTSGTLYVILSGRIYKKTAGAAWAQRENGLPAGFAALFITVDRSTVYTGGTAGLFKSVDGGGSWTQVRDVETFGLAADPYDPNHLFSWSSLMLSESTNGGTSWNAVEGMSFFTSIAFDATVPGRVYAHRSDSVRRSSDGGKSWQALTSADGIIDAQILAISSDGKTLYAGGTKAGVWTFDFARRRSAAH